MRIHAPLLSLAACLVVGIMAGKHLDNWTWGLLLLTPMTLLTCFLGRLPRLQTACIGCCVLVLGATLCSRARQQADVSWSDGRVQAEVYVNSPDDLSVVERVKGRFLLWRHQLLEHYQSWNVQDEVYGVIAAMTLGERSKLDKELKVTYSHVGASHILALSGLHLMIIYSVISLFVGWRRFRIVSQVLIVLSMWAFAFLVGLSPSVVRAAFMISVYALLSLGYRERMSVNTLAFTAIVMLIINPLALDDIGFQLSFMAVLGILLINPLVSSVIPLHIQQRHRWLRVFWGMTCVSLSAQIGTAPLVAYYFGYFPTYFLLTNWVVIPLASVTLYLALCSLCTFWWSALQGVIVAALSWVVMLMNRLLETISHLPMCYIGNLHLSVMQVACIYLLIGCLYVIFSLKYPRFHRTC